MIGARPSSLVFEVGAWIVCTWVEPGDRSPFDPSVATTLSPRPQNAIFNEHAYEYVQDELNRVGMLIERSIII